jgi:hypothetical protein
MDAHAIKINGIRKKKVRKIRIKKKTAKVKVRIKRSIKKIIFFQFISTIYIRL